MLFSKIVIRESAFTSDFPELISSTSLCVFNSINVSLPNILIGSGCLVQPSLAVHWKGVVETKWIRRIIVVIQILKGGEEKIIPEVTAPWPPVQLVSLSPVRMLRPIPVRRHYRRRKKKYR